MYLHKGCICMPNATLYISIIFQVNKERSSINYKRLRKISLIVQPGTVHDRNTFWNIDLILVTVTYFSKKQNKIPYFTPKQTQFSMKYKINNENNIT